MPEEVEKMKEEFKQKIQKLNEKYPKYRTLWRRVFKKLESGDKQGAIQTLRTSMSVSLCSEKQEIKADIYKVLREEQKSR